MASRFVPCPLGVRCLTGARTHDHASGQYRECAAAAQTGSADPTRPAAAAAAASAKPVDADETLHVELDGQPAKEALLESLGNAEGWACAAVAEWVTERRGGPNIVGIEPDTHPDADQHAVMVSVTAPNGARLAAWDDMGGLLVDADSNDDVYNAIHALVTGMETKARETDW